MAKKELSFDLEDFKQQYTTHTYLCWNVKSSTNCQLYRRAENKSRQLQKNILKTDRKQASPPGRESAVIAEHFSNYFVEQIENIHATFEQETSIFLYSSEFKLICINLRIWTKKF